MTIALGDIRQGNRQTPFVAHGDTRGMAHELPRCDCSMATANRFCNSALGKPQQQAQVGRGGQVRFQLADMNRRQQIGTIRHDGTLSLAGCDDPVSFQFQIRSFDRDDANLQLGRQLANRG